MRFMRHFAALAGFALLGSAAVAGNLYGNARFGFFVDIPPEFTVADPEPENGDGRSFHTADGTVDLMVYGSWIMVSDFAAEVVLDRSDESGLGWELTYESAISDTAASYSGQKGGRIFYARVIATCGNQAQAGYRLEYPAGQKQKYDPVIQILNKSLRAGEGTCG